jgi:phage-related minor tail protein
MLERKEECATCGTGYVVRVCSNCAVGYDAWNVWFRAAPPELKDHTGRISVENKRMIDGILNTEFGGRVTVQSIQNAVTTHLQRAKEVANAQAQANFDVLVAQEIAAATQLLDRNLAADRHLAAQLQKHADLAAQKTLTAKIHRLGRILRLL